MKILFELFILLSFFASYTFWGIYPAIALAMGLYTAQFAFLWLTKRPIERIQWLTLLIVLLLGSSSLIFQNEMFFKWKPSLIYSGGAIAILAMRFFKKGSALELVLGKTLELPAQGWLQLDYAWTIFLTFLAALNLWIAYTFSTEIWVYFKLFGTIALLLLFIVAQSIYFYKRGAIFKQLEDN